MSTLGYSIDRGQGPNLDRLMNSLRYRYDPDARVLVTFVATLIYRPMSGTARPFDATINMKGEVRALHHIDDSTVGVTLDVYKKGILVADLQVVARYNHKIRSGSLDVITF